MSTGTEFDKELEKIIIACEQVHSDFGDRDSDEIARNAQYLIKQAVDKYVLGDSPRPFINGKYPKKGETVQVDLDNNYIESLKFIQDNAAYTEWEKIRQSLWGNR